MAEIKIYGKLVNKTTDGILADAHQIKYKETTVSNKLDKIDNMTTKDIRHENENLDEYLSSMRDTLNSLRKYETMALANAAIASGELVTGDICSIGVGSGDSSTFSAREYVGTYKLYIVSNGVLSEVAANTYTSYVGLTVDELLVDGVNILGESIYEANIGSNITFKYRFESEQYPDVRGTVMARCGSTIIKNSKEFPNGDPREFTYNTESLEPGRYTFSIYGIESTNKQTERTSFSILVGGLNVKSNFDEGKSLTAGEDIRIPVQVTSADDSEEITYHIELDGEEIISSKTEIGNREFIIPADKVSTGIHNIRVWLTNSRGKYSNILTYNIAVVEPGIIYIIKDTENYTAADGARLDMPFRVIQLNEEESEFLGKLEIRNSNGDVVREGSYTLVYGRNLIQVIGLSHQKNNGDFTEYSGKITVSPLGDENNAKPAVSEFKIIITENDYNISMLGDENLLCCFRAIGKSNNSTDRDVWTDESGKGVNASFHNFNWETNGWLDDESGNTALTLNSGAYVELDIAPFAKEIAPGESMTVSVDFATRDILDSNAKVFSCLQEYEGDENLIYYLRDSFGDYIKKGEANIINYFKNIGGYCFINGEEYQADGITEYETTTIVSERTENYNLGDENPDYDGKTNFKKFKGYTRRLVTKQKGMYIDTQYAVLSHSGSMSNIMDKFYLNFSEDTRTRIDFVITRNTSTDPNENPYCFQAMIGYTNGILSLMKALSPEEQFEQLNIRNDKFKIYLGGKGVINENDGSVGITETGSAKIYSVRLYNRALTPGEILNNYAAEIPDMEKKKLVIDNNDLLKKGTMAQLPQLCLIGYNYKKVAAGAESNTIKKFIMQLKDNGDTKVEDLKKIKEPAYLTYTDPLDNSKSWKIKDANGEESSVIPIRLQFQGTSSMVYPVKNYKFKMYSGFSEDESGKIEYAGKYKRDIGNGKEESTICLKADYMDSSHTNNTGSANFISDYNTLSGQTPASELDSAYRTTIFGYPILVYYKLNEADTEQHFIGVYNLNLDKSCTGSFGFEEELDDKEGTTYDFKEVRFIEDELTQDILVKATVDGEGLTETEQTMQMVITDSDGELKKVTAQIMQNADGKNYAARYNDVFYRVNYIETVEKVNEKGKVEKSYKMNNSNIGDPYIVLKDPITGIECALLTEENFIRTLSFDKISSTQCDEFKANSGAAGAGGFGNYEILSIATDLECRYPDDGDLEDEQYESYQSAVKSLGQTPIDFKYFKAGWYYNYQRMMKWVKNSDEQEFVTNISRNFNKNYALDYYLTIMLLGGVDSLGKNLMVATWGPENHLFVTTKDALNIASENYDAHAFEYQIGDEIVYLTPTKVKTTGEYKHAVNADGFLLYYKEECYNRGTGKFENGYTEFGPECVTTKPGNDIFYPIFYDIDTINGLDNSGQLLFDVDIEIGDQLADGTAIFNTDDSHLWRRIRDYFGKNGDLKNRWNQLRSSGYFTEDNMIKKFYYERQIAKIPEKYYNDDCFLKYIWEGPNPQQGSGSYLYCIHGSRYEHIKRWYSQRMYYIDSLFGIMGGSNSSLRFNHGSYDANFGHTSDYYASYPALAAKYPDKYQYDQVNDQLLDATSGRVITPVEFNVKTYQPAYVGVKWANTGAILYYRVGRDGTAVMRGNVPSAGDSEVFLFGDKNIKELGDLSPYNVKQVDFRNLTKLSKLILGSDNYSSVINKLDLGTNSYLAELQLTNCSSLSTVDVSGCSNLRNVEMTGSGITTVTLPRGGALESIAYSDAITSIRLEDFVNLNTVKTPSLTNLTQLIIKNCPKILGTPESPNSKGWSILQQTRTSTNLTTINMTAYGNVDPIISGNTEFFFADKYYKYATSSNIRGEAYYTGSIIPANYAYFDEAYPKLTIKYTNVKDGSNMFADYKNLSCIQKISAFTGNNTYGEPTYKNIYCWVDETQELKDRWHKSEIYEKYGFSDKYVNDSTFYVKAGVYYRPLKIHDKNDLDAMRSEIKKALSSFSGVRFTSVAGMFKNNTVIDYLDPDTFNEIDLSVANTDEMFSGCTNLRYMTLPGDNVKYRKVFVYYDAEGNIVDKNDWNEETGTVLQKQDSDGNNVYLDPFTNKEVIASEGVYPKGIRKLGERMFLNCKRLRLLIKHISSVEKIDIKPSAFEYSAYNPALESQKSDVSAERPVIMFEMKESDLLEKTSEPTTLIEGDIIENIPVEGVDGLYYAVSSLDGDRVLDFDNQYINFNNSNKWFREVYFNIDQIVLDDIESYENFKISYALRHSGEKILLDAEIVDDTLKTSVTAFNKTDGLTTPNKLNIYSACQGCLEKTSDFLLDLEMPLPRYDCLDTSIPKQLYERSILSYFSSANFTDFSQQNMSKFVPVLTNFYVVGTKIIKSGSFTYLTNIQNVGVSEEVEEIAERAFEGCINLKRIGFRRSTDSAALKLYSKIRRIGDDAFINSGIASTLQLPNTLVELGESAFENCQNLTSVVYGKNMTYIPNRAFRMCGNIEQVSGVSKDITYIGEDAFFECKKMEFFSQDGNTLALNSYSGNLDYFSSLERIGANAFYKCSKISSGSVGEDDKLTIRKLIIPTSLKEIGMNAFYQDLGYESQINIEFVWSDEKNAYSELTIGSNAFCNIRTSWTPKNYSEPIEDCIFVPRIATIGSNAFRSRGSTHPFKLALIENGDYIGTSWVSAVNKIIFNFKNMVDVGDRTYLLSDNGVKKSAYLYYIKTQLSQLDIPTTISYDNSEYYLKELLKGSLDLSNASGTLSTIIFRDDSELEIIEKDVLQSSNLRLIVTGNIENVVPDKLLIESGNNFKNTAWFENIQDIGFVTLGKYIIGYNNGDEDITSLDFGEVSHCNTIFDGAFSDLSSLSSINLTENIERINIDAFRNCSSLDEVKLPSNLKFIGDNAFIDCPVREIVIPKSVETIGTNAPFGISNASKIGTLRSVIIEDGCTISNSPFVIQKEIVTGILAPTDANITLKRLHIPSSAKEPIKDAQLKQLSQVTELTVGNLRVADDGSYLIDNYPLYIDADGNRYITPRGHETEKDIAYNEKGERLYCPAFYYDMVKVKFPDLFIETTAAKSVYPLSDTETSDGFAMNLDIGSIMTYTDMKYDTGNPEIANEVLTLKELSREDIMRIIAGFTKKGSSYYTLYLRNKDYRKLTLSDNQIIGEYKVIIKQYQNK